MAKTLKAHEYADLFPMMTDAEIEGLASDIKENGLQHPVVLYKGEILDGRNRYKACGLAGIEPSFIEYDGDESGLLARVISLNVQRRDLTPGQRAIVAARTWMASGGPNNKGGRPGKESVKTLPVSLDGLSRQFKTSKPSIQQAFALLTEATDLAAQVEANATTLAKATDELKRRMTAAKQAAKDAERTAEYSEAVASGDMTIEEAIQRSIQEERERKAIADSQADARREQLKMICQMVSNIETYLDHKSDDDAEWYWQDGPGQFEHGLTSDRISNAAAILKRAADFAPKGATRGKK